MAMIPAGNDSAQAVSFGSATNISPVFSSGAYVKMLNVDGVYYMAFTSSTGSDYYVYFTTSTDGTSWSSVVASPGATLNPLSDTDIIRRFDLVYNSSDSYFGFAYFSNSADEIVFTTTTDFISWSATTTIFESTSGDYISIDFSTSSDFMTAMTRTDAVTSSDAGLTWSNFVTIDPLSGDSVGEGFIGVAGPAGNETMHAMHARRFSGDTGVDIVHGISTDQGVTWATSSISGTQLIDDPLGGFDRPSAFAMDDNGLPAAAFEEFVSFDAVKTLVYAKWDSSGTWTTSSPDPVIEYTVSGSDETMDIIFFSVDKPIIAYAGTDEYPFLAENSTGSFTTTSVQEDEAITQTSEVAVAYDVCDGELGYAYVSGAILKFAKTSLDEPTSGCAVTATPDPPTNFVTSTVSDSSISFTWTDNSIREDQEDNFIFDYITGNTVADFPGTVSNPVQNATTSTVTGLSPNTQYTFRVAATNALGTSSYATSTAQYTDPVSPGTPSASATGKTTASVSWASNDNGSGTVYEVYNVTTNAVVATTTAVSYSVTGLASGTSYQFKVRAQYLSDTSLYTDYSSESGAVTTEDNPSYGALSTPSSPASPTVVAPAKIIASLNSTDTDISVGNYSLRLRAEVDASKISATIVFEPSIVSLVLEQDEEALVDTDNDGENDILVHLEDISGDTAELTIIAIDDLEFSVNQAQSSTTNRDVTLYLNSPDAVFVAIANTNNFSTLSYESYATRIPWVLSPGNGEKTVYVKIKNGSGGEKVLSDTILLTGQADDAIDTPEDQQPQCPLDPKNAYKTSENPAVYYITTDCTKRAFTNPRIFFSYFAAWSEVIVVDTDTLNAVSDDPLGFMPWGPRYDPKYGALVKIVKDPRVYLLLGTEKYWIVSETVFTELGYAWDWIEDVDEDLLDTYTTASEITYTDHHPNETIVKYEDSPRVYILKANPDNPDMQRKHWIPDEETFASLGFRDDRIVTIPQTEVYEDGSPIE